MHTGHVAEHRQCGACLRTATGHLQQAAAGKQKFRIDTLHLCGRQGLAPEHGLGKCIGLLLQGIDVALRVGHPRLHRGHRARQRFLQRVSRFQASPVDRHRPIAAETLIERMEILQPRPQHIQTQALASPFTRLDLHRAGSRERFQRLRTLPDRHDDLEPTGSYRTQTHRTPPAVANTCRCTNSPRRRMPSHTSRPV
ncbi:MAG: hypothetical protein P8Y78_10505 [Acidihalobacter sp.]